MDGNFIVDNYMLGCKSFSEKDYIRAIGYFTIAANLGHPESQYKLAQIYEDGRGIPKNYGIAIRYYKMASNKGYAKAQCDLGFLYEGLNIWEKAFKYYKLAAKNGLPVAHNNLANYYLHGRCTEKNCKKALKHYKIAVKLGYSRSLYTIGSIYENGMGIAKDYSKALKYYKRSAGQNDTSAIYKIGWFYETGMGVEQNYNTAFEYYKLASGSILSDYKIKFYTDLIKKIPLLLIKYDSLLMNEGVSYLFFSNFIAYLSHIYNIRAWDDELFRQPLIDALIENLTGKNPEFDIKNIDIWFDDLFG